MRVVEAEPPEWRHLFETLATSCFRLAQSFPLDSENRFGTRVNHRVSGSFSANPVETAGSSFWQSLRQGGEVIEIDNESRADGSPGSPTDPMLCCAPLLPDRQVGDGHARHRHRHQDERARPSHPVQDPLQEG